MNITTTRNRLTDTEKKLAATRREWKKARQDCGRRKRSIKY